MCIEGHDGEEPGAIEASQSRKTSWNNMIFKKRTKLSSFLWHSKPNEDLLSNSDATGHGLSLLPAKNTLISD